MDLYHVWFDLKPGELDLEVCAAVDAYLGQLRSQGKLEGWRTTRRKLGFGPRRLGEFHVVIEFRDLAQIDEAFGQVATRAGTLEELHGAVNQRVLNFTAALYRDFPDGVRETGGERF